MDYAAQQWIEFFNSGKRFDFHYSPVHSNTNEFGMETESVLTNLLYSPGAALGDHMARHSRFGVNAEMTDFFANLPDPVISLSLAGINFPTIPFIPWEEIIFVGLANQNELARVAQNGFMLQPYLYPEKDKQTISMVDMYIILNNPYRWLQTVPPGYEKVINLKKTRNGIDVGKIRTWLNPFLTNEQTVEFLYLFQLLASIKGTGIRYSDGTIFNGVIFEQFKKSN